MSSSGPRSDLWFKSLRWFARFWGLAFAVLILALALGGGFHPLSLTKKELMLAIPFFIAWVGLLAGWKWERLGGCLVVGGIGAFCLVHFVVTGFRRLPGWAFPIIAVPGLLYLFCWFYGRSRRGSLN